MFLIGYQGVVIYRRKWVQTITVESFLLHFGVKPSITKLHNLILHIAVQVLAEKAK